MRRSGLIYHRTRDAYARMRWSEFLTGFRLRLYFESHVLAAGSTVWLYAVHDRENDAVKFGIARDTATRMRGLQIGNPGSLVLVGACPATVELERFFHDALKPWRIRGEWFRCCDQVLALTDLILAGEDLAYDVARYAGEDGDEPGLSAHDTIAHLTTDIAEMMAARA